MNVHKIIILHVLCMSKCILGMGCPKPNQMNPRTTAGDRSMCAIVYMDATNDAWTSCGGESREVYNGEETADLGKHWNNKISSLVVREGCTLMVYEHSHYENDHKEMRGIHENLDHERINIQDWDNEISSYICKCNFEPVDCVPTDGWAEVMECINDRNDQTQDSTCKYKQSHGFTVGKEISSGGNLNASETLSIGSELGFLFKSSTSLSAGYNWQNTQEFQQTMTEGIEISNTLAPGEHIIVSQFTGMCGGSIVKTHCFSMADVNSRKEIRTEGCPDT